MILLTLIMITPSRIQGEDALAKMTKLAYSHFSRGYFEKDRLLFSLMLTTEASTPVYIWHSFHCCMLANSINT